MRVLVALASFGHDAAYALRGLRRAPGFALTIVASMGVGVGANAAVFSLLDRVYFRSPTGVVEAGNVRRLYFLASRGDGLKPVQALHFSVPDLRDLAQSVHRNADVEGYRSAFQLPLGDGGDSAAVGMASTGLLPMLGVRAERGRLFAPDEGLFGDPRFVAVLSDRFWRKRFGADSSVLGRTLVIDSKPFIVIGISQADFDGIDLEATEIWVPLAAVGGGSEIRGTWYDALGAGVVQLVMRLRRGESEPAVGERLTVQFRRTNAPRPRFDPQARIVLAPLLEARGPVGLGPRDDRNLSLAIRLAGLSFAVLVIAVTNVASLLLMRALRRRRETAVRLALGASRRRLLGQGISESLLLTGIAASAAIVVTQWTGALLRVMLLGDVRWTGGIVDHRVVLVVYSLAVLSALAAGAIPGLLVSADDIALSLKPGAPEASGPAPRLGSALLVVQIALCMGLLAGAGVFLQSLRRVQTTERGFDADQLITVDVGGRLTSGQELPDLALRIGSLPDVLLAAVASSDLRVSDPGIPMSNAAGDSLVGVLGPSISFVEPSYLRASGVRLVSGRLLAREDGASSERATVVTETVARLLFPQGAVGQCVFADPSHSCTRVVGVVRDLKWDVSEPTHTHLFVPLAQAPRAHSCCLLVRTRGIASAADLAQVAGLARPALGFRGVRVLRVSDRLEPLTRPWRVAATLFALFGILALVAAACGVYGLVGYDVTRRSREFAIRIALGAEPRQIMLLTIRSQGRILVVALAVGLTVAIAVGRVSGALLYATSAYDPVAIGGAAIMLALVALLAAAVPALRATRSDPVATLRLE